jgi:hypothetical protein
MIVMKNITKKAENWYKSIFEFPSQTNLGSLAFALSIPTPNSSFTARKTIYLFAFIVK